MSLEIDVEKKLGNFSLRARLSACGKVAGVLGPSGCGKSLTLQMVAGVRSPDRGRVVLNGRVLYDSDARVNLPPQKRRVGYLFQNYALFPTMSVEENIACGVPRSAPRAERRKLAREWMENMRLDESLAKSRPWELSGGQQQRVALARLLASEPEILLLDEPFSSLDAFLRERMVTEVKDVLRRNGREAVLVTHNRDEAYELCDTLAVMDGGRIVESGSAREVFARPRTTAGAIVTGCKNVEEARKTGPFELFVPAWNATFTTAAPVPDSACAAGLRAHYFSPDIAENRFPVEIVEEVEEPFAWIVGFRYAGASARGLPVWWRLSKDSPRRDDRRVRALGIAPENVLPLRRPEV